MRQKLFLAWLGVLVKNSTPPALAGLDANGARLIFHNQILQPFNPNKGATRRPFTLNFISRINLQRPATLSVGIAGVPAGAWGHAGVDQVHSGAAATEDANGRATHTTATGPTGPTSPTGTSTSTVGAVVLFAAAAVEIAAPSAVPTSAHTARTTRATCAARAARAAVAGIKKAVVQCDVCVPEIDGERASASGATRPAGSSRTTTTTTAAATTV